ncbi:MAG: TonB-dependent receptor plug domain-containing protein [Ferruginibacter sp.]
MSTYGCTTGIAFVWHVSGQFLKRLMLNGMNKYIGCLFFLMACCIFAAAQKTPGSATSDTIKKVNEEVTVYAFSRRATLINTAVAVSVLDKSDLARSDQNSFVSSVNTVPGVKMDERSPGSYRISLRGNLLRSTFGVRNVKVYLNGLPFTDASGNTYFNQLAINSIDKMEIIKGPAGSMYGAGTGGVILLSNEPGKQRSEVSVSAGSYGLFSAAGKYFFGKEKLRQSVSYTHQQSNGYRDQSRLRRDVAGYTVSAYAGKQQRLTGNILYSNLFYETPGGLTAAQAAAAPRQSRPATALFRSAADQQAAIYLNTLYTSLSDEITINSRWKNVTGAYFSYTELKNPSIRNYEDKNEKGGGGRSVFQFETRKFSAAFGAEYQYSYINTSVFNNVLGSKTALQFHDKIPVHQVNIFAQAGIELPFHMQLTAGLSYNNFYYGFHRVSAPVLKDAYNFSPQYIPRISLLKKFGTHSSAYFSYSLGYSPPTIDEIHAGNGVFNIALAAEQGTNYEAGFKTMLADKRLYASLSVYLFRLRNTIVSRRDASGGDFFVNAGKTKQQGMEFSLRYLPVDRTTGFVNRVQFQTAVTNVRATFSDYRQGAVDHSGNKLTGTSPCVFSFLADVVKKPGLYTNLTYTYTDRIPLNDANVFFATAYNLIFLKLGWQKKISAGLSADLFAGLQKGFNKQYSLGNDLNADGNRFFNPAALQSFTAGVALRF